MKHLILFLSFLILSGGILAQKPKIKDGPYTKYFKSGALKTSGQYKNKKAVGEWKNYYESGEISSIYIYTDGKINALESKRYFKSGSIKSETIEVGGVHVNREFYATGKLLYERLPKGGYHKEYLEDGTLKIEGNYENNALFGTWRQFYPTGQIQWKVEYNNSYKKGPYKLYYENGQLKAEGNHNADEKDGKEVHYDEGGNKINEIKYRDGIIVKSEKNDFSNDLIVVPNGVFENIPIYPGCENELGYVAKKKCMSDKIAKFVIENFNTKIVGTYELSGKQKIYLIFKINKEGLIVDIDAKAPHYGVKLEAIRVIELLPKMKPGIQRGKNVIVPFSLPIIFETKK